MSSASDGADEPDTPSSSLVILDALRCEDSVELPAPLKLSRCIRMVNKRDGCRVKRLLASGSSWTPSDVQAAKARLLEPEFLAAETSIGFFLKQIPLYMSFIRFLLEASSDQGPSLPAAQANPMVMALVQHLTGTILNLKAESNENDTDEDMQDSTIDPSHFHFPTVASFTMAALLHSLQPYTSSRPCLMSYMWKGICDLATPLRYTSLQFAEDALTALLLHVRCVMSQALPTLKGTNHASRQQQQLHAKVLIFLTARMSILLPLYLQSQPNDCELLLDALKALCEMSGIALALRIARIHPTTLSSTMMDPSSLAKEYEPLETKANHCILKIAFFSGTTVVQNENFFDSDIVLNLLRQDGSSSSECDPFRQACQSLGKLQVLRALLQRACTRQAVTTDDAELLILILEDLFFCTFPRCHAYLTREENVSCPQVAELLVVFTETMSDAIMLSTLSGPDPEAACHLVPIHHRLCHWLAPAENQTSLHPLTCELLHTVLHGYLGFSSSPVYETDSCRAIAEAEKDAPHLLVLMVKLLFDARTVCELRRNVEAILLRVIVPGPAISGTLFYSAHQLIVSEFLDACKNNSRAEQKKRRRRSSRKEERQAQSFRTYSTMELEILWQILSAVASTPDPSLDNQISLFCRDLVSMGSGAGGGVGGEQKYWLCQRPPASASLLLSCVGGILEQEADSVPSKQCFQRRTGQSLEDVCASLAAWFSNVWKRTNTETTKQGVLRLGKGQSIATAMSLHFLSLSFRPMGHSYPIDTLGLIQSTALACATYATRAREANLDDTEQQVYAVMILNHVNHLLSKIAAAIPKKCPPFVFEGIAETFRLLLSSQSWDLVLESMTAFVEYAKDIQKVHKHYLQRSIPNKQVEKLFMARLNNKVYTPVDCSLSDMKEYETSLNESLLELVPKSDPRLGFLSSNASRLIEEGSYVVSMKTESGRNAMVIFPPGEQTLGDIESMAESSHQTGIMEIRQVTMARPVGKNCLVRTVAPKKVL